MKSLFRNIVESPFPRPPVRAHGSFRGLSHKSNSLQPREVINTLLAVADEHGLVLRQPEPVARLDDFGDKSLVFTLQFWFDLGKASRDALSSDLRLMIEKALSESNIRIASPQGDIRFDRETPLWVEISRTQDAEL
jgi:potassium efflux system protein